MTVTVADVMRHVRNHFIRSAATRAWTLQDGQLSPSDGLAPGMWIALPAGEPGIPQGVFQLDEAGRLPGIADAAWTGTVYLLAPPEDFIRLCSWISRWAEHFPDPTMTHEALGEYSVSRKAANWQAAFGPALAPYRRMYEEAAL